MRGFNIRLTSGEESLFCEDKLTFLIFFRFFDFLFFFFFFSLFFVRLWNLTQCLLSALEGSEGEGRKWRAGEVATAAKEQPPRCAKWLCENKRKQTSCFVSLSLLQISPVFHRFIESFFLAPLPTNYFVKLTFVTFVRLLHWWCAATNTRYTRAQVWNIRISAVPSFSQRYSEQNALFKIPQMFPQSMLSWVFIPQKKLVNIVCSYSKLHRKKGSVNDNRGPWTALLNSPKNRATVNLKRPACLWSSRESFEPGFVAKNPPLQPFTHPRHTPKKLNPTFNSTPPFHALCACHSLSQSLSLEAPFPCRVCDKRVSANNLKQRVRNVKNVRNSCNNIRFWKSAQNVKISGVFAAISSFLRVSRHRTSSGVSSTCQMGMFRSFR